MYGCLLPNQKTETSQVFHPVKMAEFHTLPLPKNEPEEWTVLAQRAVELTRSVRAAPLPSLEHLSRADTEHVYEPSDDTFLLVDALHHDVALENTRIIVELGCGTGVATVAMLKLLNSGHHQVHAYMTDINPRALEMARRTAQANGIDSDRITTCNCDLASNLVTRLENQVDILIFNPPYVPTPNEEVGSIGIEASWAGGDRGRVVIDRSLSQIAQLLKRPSGVAYMIVVDDNEPHEIAAVMHERYRIKVVPFLRRRARNEFLTVLKMTFETTTTE